MTFPEYFQECQTLITKEIDLPFDCPFPQTWIDKNTADFQVLYNIGITPEKSVSVHFWDINQRGLIMVTRRKSKSKI